MTCALSLVLWMAAAQTAEMPAPAADAVVLQCPPCDAERALRAQLDGARRKLAETKAQLAMELELQPCSFPVASATSGGAR